MANIQITTFYKFLPISETRLLEVERAILAEGERLGMMGLFIIGNEGVNTTFSGEPEKVAEYKTYLAHLLNAGELTFKDSFADKHPFHNLKVKVRNEIVTLDRPDLVPQNCDRHLSPADWHKALAEEDVVVLDTRNDYEYDIGRFKNAINPKLTEFNQFPEYLKSSGIEKDKKVLIYCTGGIRCEKAILEMENQGFNNVYQLDGGILNYLAQYPEAGYEGECFVFDYRVAVDQKLQPTQKYRLCPHCGDPGQTKIQCIQCGIEEIVCEVCLAKSDEFKTCSKNCAHHKRMGHKSTRIHKDSFNKRGGASFG